MKRFTWVLASSVGLVGVAGLAAVPLACVSSNPGAPDLDAGPLSGEDAGPLPGEDATVPSDSGPGPQDGGAADVAVDSADAAPTPLTLTVLSGGAPESGVLVVFQDATGAVVSTATTDAAGTVSQLVVAGSQVTAALGTAQQPNLVTIQGVAPGDALTLVDTSAQSTSFSEQVTVTLPAGPWDASTTAEDVRAGQCGDPVAYPIYLTAGCISGGQFPLLAIAEGLTSGVESAYTYQTNNPILTDGGSATIAVTRAWTTATDTATVTTTSAPDGFEDAGATLQQIDLAYLEVAGGVASQSTPVTQTTGQMPPSSVYDVHSGYPDFVQAEAFGYFNVTSGLESEVVALARSAPPTASGTTSLALGTLPPLVSASVNAGDAGTPQQPSISWTSAGSLSAANGMYVLSQWYANPPDGGSQVDGTWTIIAPPTASTVTAPAMPSSASAFVPPSYALYSPPRVAAVQASFLAGYAGFRSQIATIPVFSPSSNVGPSIPALPADGATLFLSAIFQNDS